MFIMLKKNKTNPWFHCFTNVPAVPRLPLPAQADAIPKGPGQRVGCRSGGLMAGNGSGCNEH